MIIDNGFVVKLGRPDTKIVVRVRRSEKEPVILQEARNQLSIFRRRFPKHSLLGIKIQATRKLRERSIAHQLLKVSINGHRPLCQLLTPVDLTGTEAPF